jgi:hypothetical protein
MVYSESISISFMLFFGDRWLHGLRQSRDMPSQKKFNYFNVKSEGIVKY